MKIKTIIQRTGGVIGEKKFFVAIVGLFAAQAIIIALTAKFPMPFDENYHFSLINYYSQHVSPFIGSQPEELAVTGDSTRLGSYLSHYLMSFPLRLTSLFTSDTVVHISVLRLLNIGFAVATLFVIQRFLLRLTKSGVITNLSILAYCLLPVTTFLAAHINYDNPMLLCVAGLLVVAQSMLIRMNDGLRVRGHQVLTLATIAAVGSLVKFTFLPMATVAVLFIAFEVARRRLWPVVSMPKATPGSISLGMIALMAVTLVSAGLFMERYGLNLIKYHTPQPDCIEVQQHNTCMQYGPWARNYALKLAATNDALFEGRSFPGYVAYLWTPMMTKGLAYVGAETRVYDPPKKSEYLINAFIGLVMIGLLASLLYLRKHSMLILLASITGVYLALLIHRNYTEFMSLHALIAVQGRYLLPLILPFFGIGLLGLAIYARLITTSVRNARNWVRQAANLNPSEAYERSLSYWSTKVWRRGSAEG